MIRSFDRWSPVVPPTAYVDVAATVIGRVTLAAGASVWPGAVLRGDIEPIRLGAGSNIQDNAVAHTDDGLPTVVGRGVTVGHGAILHSCRIGDDALIGMGAVVLSGAVVGRGAMVGAGALVPPGARIPAGALVVGTPGRVLRKLSSAEKEHIRRNGRRYVALARRYVLGVARPIER